MLSNHCRPVVKYFIHQHITFSGRCFYRQLWRSLSTFSRTFMWQASVLSAVPAWLASTPVGWKSTLMDMCPRGMANSIHKRPGSFTVQNQKTFLWWEARSRESWACAHKTNTALYIKSYLCYIVSYCVTFVSGGWLNDNYGLHVGAFWRKYVVHWPSSMLQHFDILFQTTLFFLLNLQ